MLEPAMIHGDAKRSPVSVTKDEVLSALVARGAVLFRGFGCDADDLVRLTQRYSDRFTCDPTKIRGSRWQTAQGVTGRLARAAARLGDKIPHAGARRRSDDGTRAAPFEGYGLNPHNENTFIPGGCPELIWFLCQRPAENGGRSILCDGSELLAKLSRDAVRFLSDVPIRFELAYEKAQWQAVYGIDTNSELEAILDPLDDVSYELSPRGALAYTFDSIQIQPTRLDGKPAVRTNLLSRRPYGQVGSVERERTSRGEPMPAWLVEELLEAVSAVRALIDLRSDDVLLIDNSRVLHGREPYADTARRILTRLSWLKAVDV